MKYSQEAGLRVIAVMGKRDRVAWAVLKCIADNVDVDGEWERGAGQRRLAQLAGYNAKYIAKALARLERAGLLEYRRGRGPGDSSSYRLPWVAELRQAGPALRVVHKRAPQERAVDISTSARPARALEASGSARPRGAPTRERELYREACDTCAGTGWVPMSDAPRAPVVRCADCSGGWAQVR